MPDAILELDFSTKLEITINNTRPVVLTDLTLALLGVGHQFERFVEQDTRGKFKVGSELFIKEVRSGSIVVELLAQALPLAPLLWEGGSLLEWSEFAKGTIEFFLGKLDKPPRELTKTDLKQWDNILQPVAKDGGSQMNMTVSGNGNVINQVFITHEQAKVAQDGIQREIRRIDAPQDQEMRKQLMTWAQTNFADGANTGDRVVIEKISSRPVKVIFENEADKKAILAGDGRFAKQWHELAYFVDVEVLYIRDIPKAYKILGYYPDETFDPNEE